MPNGTSIALYITLLGLLQEPFNAHEFVERLAWRTMGMKARNDHDDFDPMTLHSAFEKTIGDLKDKNSLIERKVCINIVEVCLKDMLKLHTV